jgi:predicted nucleic acid-binding protein
MRRVAVNRTLAATGPLVAILSREDAFCQACVDALRGMAAPQFSCWPVITEAAWLLRHSRQAIQQLLSSMDMGFLELLPLAGFEAKAIASLMKTYESIRPHLADFSLVYLAGREQIETIFTLDRRDFSLYRTGRKRSFPILPEI